MSAEPEAGEKQWLRKMWDRKTLWYYGARSRGVWEAELPSKKCFISLSALLGGLAAQEITQDEAHGASGHTRYKRVCKVAPLHKRISAGWYFANRSGFDCDVDTQNLSGRRIRGSSIVWPFRAEVGPKSGMYLYSIGKGFGLWHLKARKDMCLWITLGNIRLAGGGKWYLEFIAARFMNLHNGPLYDSRT
jgi:hypothetical protein